MLANFTIHYPSYDQNQTSTAKKKPSFTEIEKATHTFKANHFTDLKDRFQPTIHKRIMFCKVDKSHAQSLEQTNPQA